MLAVSSYREFLTLYPQHPKSDYAQFRAAESYFKQKNSPDRDQTATEQALEEYQRLLDVYPQSTWVEPAREKIHECRQELARSHFMVGYFYQRTRQAWRSAIGRYETILSDYPDFERFDEVLFRLAECLGNAGRYAEARPHLARLQAELPAEPVRGGGQEARSELPASRRPRRPRRLPPARPRGRPAQNESAPPPRRPRRSPTGPPPGQPDLKCHFEDLGEDLLTNSLFS